MSDEKWIHDLAETILAYPHQNLGDLIYAIQSWVDNSDYATSVTSRSGRLEAQDDGE